ncbi:MAG: hypothetical protein QNJ40_05670 [Xanthomonadales bacterium]|nr:hypothetical protein [Xanthomonadales bacterium]
MNKTRYFLAFLAAYALAALSLIGLKDLGGWWWLVPLAFVGAMVIVVLRAESTVDEVMGKTALQAYRSGFWVVLLLLLGGDFARAFGWDDLRLPLVWAVGLGTWVLVYGLGLWRMR